jgi:hypothetical protein
MQRRGEKIVESPVEARQDFLGRPVPFVLVVRCTLAIVALAFHSMAFLGTHNRQSRITFHRMTHETLMTAGLSEEELFIALGRG